MSAEMLISDVLDARGIIVEPRWSTFEESVRGLIANLISRGQIPPELANSAVRSVLEREQVANTAIVEIGVSIPHARIPGLPGLVAALAVAPTAVYYAMANVPIWAVALVLSSPDQTEEHLNLLAALSMLLQSQILRRDLRGIADANAAYDLLRAREGA